MVSLHRVLFGAPGKANARKANIRKFNGWGSDDKAKDKAERSLKGTGWTTATLRDLSKLLGLETGGHKEGIADRVLTFLVRGGVQWAAFDRVLTFPPTATLPTAPGARSPASPAWYALHALHARSFPAAHPAQRRQGSARRRQA